MSQSQNKQYSFYLWHAGEMCLKERKKNVCFTANRSPIVYEKSPPDIPDNEFTFAALLQVDVKLHSKCQNCNIKLRARAHMCVGVRIFFFSLSFDYLWNDGGGQRDDI